jgi:G3E family GTPase
LTTSLPDPAAVDLAPQRPIPVSVLSGFLGSGKTTLIRRLLANPAARDTAVIVNEFGEVGLDHLLVEAAEEDTVLLGNGCLCCATHGDLVRALRSLLDRRERRELPAYERVIVETSGLADPGPILQTLMSDPLRLSRYHLAGLVTVIDGVVGGQTMAAYGEAEKQARLADRLLISKGDLASVKDLAAKLSKMAPTTVLDDDAPDPALLFDFPPQPPRERNFDATAHSEGITTIARTFDRRFSEQQLENWLSFLVERHGERILRLKGIFCIAGEDRALAVHVVQHVRHRPQPLDHLPDDQPAGQVVIIGSSFDGAETEALFAPLLA